MAHVQNIFQEKGFHQPLFTAMWFNQRELNLPEGTFNFYHHTQFDESSYF